MLSPNLHVVQRMGLKLSQAVLLTLDRATVPTEAVPVNTFFEIRIREINCEEAVKR